jgi:hypothetical protein
MYFSGRPPFVTPWTHYTAAHTEKKFKTIIHGWQVTVWADSTEPAYILEGSQLTITTNINSPSAQSQCFSHSSHTNYSGFVDYTLQSHCTLPGSFQHTSNFLSWWVMWEHHTHPETALSTQHLSLLSAQLTAP